jgi:rod shape determining protein RodA
MYRVTVSQTTLSSRSLVQRWAGIDLTLFLSTLAAVGFGVLMVYSASQGIGSSDLSWSNLAVKQAVFAATGLLLMLGMTRIEYHLLESFTWPLYLGAIGLLVMLVIASRVGHEAAVETLGAVRWFQLGPIQVQPSELAKPVLVLALAKLLADNEKRLRRPQYYLASILIMAVPTALVYEQPDLGTALACVAIWLAMVVAAKVPLRYLLGTVALAAPVVWLALNTSYILKDYQRERLLIFLHPESAPLGAGYNILQARISIGTGGLFGQGYMGGIQSQGGFLKVAQSDFIFSVVAEEFGFIGATALIALLLLITWRYLHMARHAPTPYTSLICVGLAAWLAVQIFINVGMNLSLMPVTGIPLPFISAGGTSLVSLLLAQGLVQGIALRSHKVIFGR